MRKIDGVSGREIHLEAVDAVLQLVGNILAAVSPRRRGRQAGEQRERGGEKGGTDGRS
jgi:hypothetical protein